jgi:DNA-binding MarR family transcriptional regulator
MSNSDIDRVAAWRSLLLAHNRAVRAIESDLSREGTVPLGWYDVLLELAAADGQLRMQELGVRAVLSRTRVSRIVTELEGAGLVERCPDPADGRAALAVITAAGRRAQRETAPVYLDSIERQFTRHLTEREQQTIASALQRVVVAHRAVTDPRR